MKRSWLFVSDGRFLAPVTLYGVTSSGPPIPEHQEATPILSRLILRSQPKSSNLIVFPPPRQF
jgi:hypothetical protein